MLETFSITGVDKEDLLKSLKFILDMQKKEIKFFAFQEMSNVYVNNEWVSSYKEKEKGMGIPKTLVFYSYEPHFNLNKAVKYPFKATTEVLKEHIIQYLDGLTQEDYEAFGEAPNGYEESVEYGWELYTPDGYSETHGIYENSPMTTVFAVRPKMIEYGK